MTVKDETGHANAIVRPTLFEQARLIINLVPALNCQRTIGTIGAYRYTNLSYGLIAPYLYLRSAIGIIVSGIAFFCENRKILEMSSN